MLDLSKFRDTHVPLRFRILRMEILSIYSRQVQQSFLFQTKLSVLEFFFTLELKFFL